MNNVYQLLIIDKFTDLIKIIFMTYILIFVFVTF